MTNYAKMNNLRFGVLLALAGLGAVISCSKDNGNTLNPPTTTRATVNLVDTTGKSIGTATLTENQPGTVSMVVSVTGLPAGQHGIHFHMVGKADPTVKFTTAGDHFNPDNKKHGLQNTTGGPHNGDLPNLVVGTDRTGRLETTTDRITLASGTAKSVFDSDGTALVIHANTDDQVTDPSGNSGGRIAAGVVTRN